MTGRLETCSQCWAVVETQHLKFHQEWHDDLAAATAGPAE